MNQRQLVCFKRSGNKKLEARFYPRVANFHSWRIRVKVQIIHRNDVLGRDDDPQPIFNEKKRGRGYFYGLREKLRMTWDHDDLTNPYQFKLDNLPRVHWSVYNKNKDGNA